MRPAMVFEKTAGERLLVIAGNGCL